VKRIMARWPKWERSAQKEKRSVRRKLACSSNGKEIPEEKKMGLNMPSAQTGER